MVQTRLNCAIHVARRGLTVALVAAYVCMWIGCAPQRKSYLSPRRPAASSRAPYVRGPVSHPAPRPTPVPAPVAKVVAVDGYEHFHREVLSSPAPVVTMFYIPWCHSCKGMKPIYDSMSGTYASKIKFTKVNLATNRDLVGKYDITGAPTFVMFRAGNETSRLVGPQPEPILRNTLEELSRR